MSRLRLVVLAALVLACAKAAPTALTAGDLDVQLAITPDPPTTGDNQLRLRLVDRHGRPVEGARLAFEYDMPAMGAMPEMKGGGDVKAEGDGRYTVTYPLSMAGDWTLTLGIAAPGHAPTSVGLRVSPPHKGFVVQDSEGAAASPAGARLLDIPLGRQQQIGVTFGTVEPRPLTVTLRAAGRIEVDERKLADVTLKYEAYVEALFVAETGKTVKAGQPLVRVYSPDLLAAEDELLSARRAGGAPEIVAAAVRRLASWDLSRNQIAALERRGQADGRVTIVAPVGGVVLDKPVVEGAHVMPGATLYRVGNLGAVWVQAAVYERDAPLVSVGQLGRISLPALGGQDTEARVTFVAPTVDEKTRTIEARLELLNAKRLLKPGMLADVHIDVPLGTRLSVPESALLITGEHRYAFVDRGGGKLQAVEVELGISAGDQVELKSGLEAGQRVATNATFLLSSEAKLRDALPRWTSGTDAGASR